MLIDLEFSAIHKLLDATIFGKLAAEVILAASKVAIAAIPITTTIMAAPRVPSGTSICVAVIFDNV
jgi:hypothetical protein